jgi:hypothetical protein
MFNSFPISGTANERTAKFEAYWAALRELSPGAVVAACNDVLKGRVDNPAYLPTSGCLYQQVEKHISSYRSKPRRQAEPIVHDTRPKEPFDPSATTFSCYRLGMNMDQIKAAVMAYRRGEDWRALVLASGGVL